VAHDDRSFKFNYGSRILDVKRIYTTNCLAFFRVKFDTLSEQGGVGTLNVNGISIHELRILREPFFSRVNLSRYKYEQLPSINETKRFLLALVKIY